MNVPVFTAEASLYKTGRYYASFRLTRVLAAEIYPALTRRVSRGSTSNTPTCTATPDGGQWCCIRGPEGPICWKKPPPDIVTASRVALT